MKEVNIRKADLSCRTPAVLLCCLKNNKIGKTPLEESLLSTDWLVMAEQLLIPKHSRTDFHRFIHLLWAGFLSDKKGFLVLKHSVKDLISRFNFFIFFLIIHLLRFLWYVIAAIQELFAKLTRMASMAADMFVGRERFATLLLMRLTETVILWLSEDQSFWDDIEEGPRPLGPVGLQQVFECDVLASNSLLMGKIIGLTFSF